MYKLYWEQFAKGFFGAKKYGYSFATNEEWENSKLIEGNMKSIGYKLIKKEKIKYKKDLTIRYANTLEELNG